MAKTPATICFEATLLQPDRPKGAAWAFLVLPADASAKLPTRSMTTVDGTLAGHRFQATLEPDGQGSHWLKVGRALREAAGAVVGDIIALAITPVAVEPEPRVPVDLRRALAATPAARAQWSSLTPVARRDWIHWITSGKKAETASGASSRPATCSRPASAAPAALTGPGSTASHWARQKRRSRPDRAAAVSGALASTSRGRGVRQASGARGRGATRQRGRTHTAETEVLQRFGQHHSWSSTMSETSPITGELSNTKVAAVFQHEAAAHEAAQAVSAALSLGSAQVQVITPAEPHPGHKLEPESRGIGRTIVVAHVRLGIAGAVAGVLVFAALYAMGLPFIVNSAVAAGLVLLCFGALAGLMLGGLVSLRPDHDRYIEATREAMAAGNTTVVVHAFSAEQRQQAAELLRAQGGEVTSTL